MELQPIYNVAELCHKHGIQHVILSPGSRSAPLTLAFARHPEITTRIIPDERSAAFIALGLAQSLKTPVVLVCTSGSAVLNYAPAVAEAFFNHVPLVIMSADRPPEWLGQRDGQTIWQNGVFGKHVVFSTTAPVDLSHDDAAWHLNRQVNEALNAAASESQPVHINFPFREPFYPAPEDPTYYESDIQVINQNNGLTQTTELQQAGFMETWHSHRKKLILVGQNLPEEQWLKTLDQVTGKLNIPVIGDITSNIHGLKTSIHGADLHLREGSTQPESFCPDLLITFGRSILSKNIKSFFRKYKPATHWHVDQDRITADTLQSMTCHIHTDPLEFLQWINNLPADDEFTLQKQANYLQLWKYEQDKVRGVLDNLFEEISETGQFELVYKALDALPNNTNLHLANSMAVRYANHVGLEKKKADVVVYSNRGVCGIDGCNSTAVGVALADPARMNVLITGDMAFLYDRNAFWHNYALDNLRVIVLNDHGGGIFRLINGPSQLPELGTFFETKQKLNAKSLSEEFGFDYIKCDKRSKMTNLLQDFFLPDNQTKVMEIETEGAVNQKIMSRFKKSIQ